MIICLCGKSCSGKSTFAQKLTHYMDKSLYIDIDEIAHDILKISEVQEELVDAFGKEILSNEVIDRKKLGLIVFNSENEMNKLTDITWKYMERKIDTIIKNNKDKTIILDYLLLPKTKYFKKADLKILLDIPYEIRKKRALERDNITSEEFALREKNSIEYDFSDFDIIYHDNKSFNNKEVLSLFLKKNN